VITVLVLLSIAFLIAAVLLVRHLLGIQSKSQWSARLHNKVPPKVSLLLCRLRDAPYGKLRVPLVVLQILTQFVSITGLPLPPLYYKFVRWVSAVNVDVQWLMPSGCLIEMNFHQQLLVVTLMPLVFIALLGALQCVFVWRNTGIVRGLHEFKQRSEALAAATVRHSTVFLGFTFLIFSTVSTAVLQTFACDQFSDVGQSWLRADYSILCTSATHRGYQAYAAVMIFVYPLGIPALYAWLLWRNKEHITAAGTDAERANDPTLSAIKFLWEPYRKEAYWWEVAECLRRLALTGFLVFILPGTAGQAAVSCLLAIVSMVVFGMARPLTDWTDVVSYWAGCLTLFISMFVALLIKGGFAGATGQSQQLVSAVLIVLNASLVLAALRQLTLKAVQVAVQHPELRSKSVRSLRSLLALTSSTLGDSTRSNVTAACSASGADSFCLQDSWRSSSVMSRSSGGSAANGEDSDDEQQWRQQQRHRIRSSSSSAERRVSFFESSSSGSITGAFAAGDTATATGVGGGSNCSRRPSLTPQLPAVDEHSSAAGDSVSDAGSQQRQQQLSGRLPRLFPRSSVI
jgi:hypothetical protein